MPGSKKVLNPQVFLELSCYVTFAVLMVYLVSSGSYQSYVTPRMVPYLYFTAAVMVIWSGLALAGLFRPQHKIRVGHCFVLAIPIMFLLLPHSPLSASDLSSAYWRGSASLGRPFSESWTGVTSSENPLGGNSNLAASQGVLPTSGSSLDSGSAEGSAGPTVPQADENALSLPGLDTKNKKIVVRDEDFSLWLTELYSAPENYEGYQISIKGFVFRDPKTMQDNEFVPARLAMSCCVADLTTCGIVCRYAEASQLKADTWVTVEGVIHREKYQDDYEPVITATGISAAEKPKEEYIYPF